MAQDAPTPSGRSEFPSDQHRRLNSLVGEWKVATRYVIGPDQEREGTADCSVRWLLDGHVLEMGYQSEIQGRPFVVLQYLGYDVQRKVFFEIKFDNMDTGLLHNEGTISEDGRAINQKGDRIDPRTGRSTKIRTVTTLVDPDHFTIEWFSPGTDGEERRTVFLAHTRKK
jgi:hypothetical protein